MCLIVVMVNVVYDEVGDGIVQFLVFGGVNIESGRDSVEVEIVEYDVEFGVICMVGNVVLLQ